MVDLYWLVVVSLLCFTWWLYPIKWLIFGRKPKANNDDTDDPFRLLRDTENAIIDALKNSNGTALQMNIKNSLPENMKLCFDEAVNELYQNGVIKTSKDGGRVRLKLA